MEKCNGKIYFLPDTVEGICEKLPVLGSFFFMTGESIDPTKDLRVIETSEVMLVHNMIKENNTIDFNTMNSMYTLEIIE